MKILKSSEYISEKKNTDRITLYHGTKADFKAFDSGFINSGWGEQAYGYGFYLTDSMETAEAYSRGGRVMTVTVPAGKYLDYKGISRSEAMTVARKFFKYYTNTEYGREAYPDAEYRQMFWDEECKYVADSADGGDIYGNVSALLGDDKEASEFLHGIGYVGIKFLCENTNTGEKFHNYVIFDAKDIEIVS